MNEELREHIKRNYQRQVAGQPEPDPDDPIFSFIATTPISATQLTVSDSLTIERIALCVLLKRENVEEMIGLIDACWQAAEERRAELRVYLGYAGNILWKRPGFEQLQADVEAGEIDLVLVGEYPSSLASTKSERTDYMGFWRGFFQTCRRIGVQVESFDPRGPEQIVPSMEDKNHGKEAQR